MSRVHRRIAELIGEETG